MTACNNNNMHNPIEGDYAYYYYCMPSSPVLLDVSLLLHFLALPSLHPSTFYVKNVFTLLSVLILLLFCVCTSLTPFYSCVPEPYVSMKSGRTCINEWFQQIRKFHRWPCNNNNPSLHFISWGYACCFCCMQFVCTYEL